MCSGTMVRRLCIAGMMLACLTGSAQAYTTEFASRMYVPMSNEYFPNTVPTTVYATSGCFADDRTWNPFLLQYNVCYYVGQDTGSGEVAALKWYLDGPDWVTGQHVFFNMGFELWFYQHVLTHNLPTSLNGDPDDRPHWLPIEQAPMRLGVDWTITDDEADGSRVPKISKYYAKFAAIEGLDSLKYIPWAGTDGQDPPVASARYRVVVGGNSPNNLFEAHDSQPGKGSNLMQNARHNGLVSASDNYDWDLYTGAVFFVTAVYDETMFDVSIAGWKLGYDNEPETYEKVYHLQSAVSVPFIPWGYLALPRFWFTPTPPDKSGGAVFNVPEYVTIRLRPGRRLEDLQGRTVRLMLHTINSSGWRGHTSSVVPNHGCGETMSFSCTSQILVGADPDAQVNDWHIEPPALQDECVPPPFDKADTKGAEADAVGTRVVNSLCVDKPALRAGFARMKVGPTLSETLGNEACWEAFMVRSSRNLPLPYTTEVVEPSANDTSDNPYVDPNPIGDASFLRANINGRWFAVDDIPGLQWYWEGNNDPSEDDDDQMEWLVIHDTHTNMYYRYLAPPCPSASCPWPKEGWGLNDGQWDELPEYYNYAFRNVKLVQVDDGALQGDPFLKYKYDAYDPDNGAPTGKLVSQIDQKQNRISYNLTEAGTVPDDTAQLVATAAGGAGSIGTRVVKAGFGSDSATKRRPLRSAAGVDGGAWRQYEWFPSNNPATPTDGKLKKVSDGDDNVLTRLEYDERGRLIRRSRGSDTDEKTMAEYKYTDPPLTPTTPITETQAALPPIPPTTMDAKFYVEDGEYELIHYTFSPEGQMLQIDQYQKLQPTGGDNPVATTKFDYRPSGTGSYVIKTLPGGKAAEYTESSTTVGSNMVNHFLAPPLPASESGSTSTDPPQSPRVNWTQYDYRNIPYDDGDGVDINRWYKKTEVNKSNGGTTTTYDYDSCGFLTCRTDPMFITLSPSSSSPVSLQHTYRRVYHTGRHSFMDSETATGPHGEDIKTEYGHNDYWDITHREASGGGLSATWDYGVNVFGEQFSQMDPDGCVTWKDFWDKTGLLAGMCVYENRITGSSRDAGSAPGGNVLQQTQYVYNSRGMLETIKVADHEGPFAKDSPTRWITTTYGYDNYGRLTSRTVVGDVSYGTTYYEYDFQDRLKKITFPDGRSKEIVRDGRGQIVEIRYYGTDNQCLKSTYAYDLAGNLIDRKTEGCPKCGPHTTYEYDLYNRRITETRTEAGQ